MSALHQQSERQPEQLFEYQAAMRRAACAFVIIQRSFFGWKMNLTQGFSARWKSITFAQFNWKCLGDGGVGDCLQNRMNNLAQLFWPQVANFAIDGHAPAHVNRCQRWVVIRLTGQSGRYWHL